MFDTFSRFWRELADEGVITESEYVPTNSRRSIARSRNSRPLQDPACGSPRRPAPEHVESRHQLRPHAADFARHGDPRNLPRALSDAAFLSEPTLPPVRGGPPASSAPFSMNSRARYGEACCSGAARSRHDYIHIVLVCRKSGPRAEGTPPESLRPPDLDVAGAGWQRPPDAAEFGAPLRRM
jgi:hypothetical protein